MCHMASKPCSAREGEAFSCQPAISWLSTCEEMVCSLFRVIVSFLSSLFTALGSVTFDLTCNWVSTPMFGRVSERPA